MSSYGRFDEALTDILYWSDDGQDGVDGPLKNMSLEDFAKIKDQIQEAANLIYAEFFKRVGYLKCIKEVKRFEGGKEELLFHLDKIGMRL